MSERDKIIFGSNLKYLRKRRGLTQQELADQLRIRRSSIGAYEECRATPRYDTLEDIADFFKVSIDMLVREDLEQFSDEEFQNRQEARKMDIEGKNIRVLHVSIDNEGKENVEFVPMKASAGYLDGFADREYIEDLPKFQIPMPAFKNGTFRAFEIKGDSMLPIKPGSIIIGEYVRDWRDIKDGQTYIIISDSDGIVYKRVFSQIGNDGTGELMLKSDNAIYPPYPVKVEDVREIWRAKMFMSMDFPEPEMSIEKLSAMVLDMQSEILKMKGKYEA